MEVVEIILETFKEHKIGVGEVLEKSLLMERLKNLPPAKKAEVRDSWHFLVSQGIIREVPGGKGPILTDLGYSMIYTQE